MQIIYSFNFEKQSLHCPYVSELSEYWAVRLSWVWGHFASNLTIAYNITFLKDLNTLATSELILHPYQCNVKTPRVNPYI